MSPVGRHALHSDLDGWAVRRRIEQLLNGERVAAVLGFWHEAAFLPALLGTRRVTFGMVAAAPYSAWFRPPPGVRDLLAERGKRSLGGFVASFAWRAAFRNPVARAPGAMRRDRLFVRPLLAARVVIARSAFVRNDLVQLFGVPEDRIRVAWCGVDGDFFRVSRDARDKALSRLLFVGALRREKGVFDALEALALAVSKGGKNLQLRLAGGGDRSAVMRMAQALGISDRIEVLGHLQRPALLEQLAWAQVALLPSHFESFGLAVAEAQAAGVPVIAYSVGALPEIVEDGTTGWLVPFGDREGLASAVAEAHRDSGLAGQRGARARHRAARLFSWGRSAEIILEALDRSRAMNGRTTENTVCQRATL